MPIGIPCVDGLSMGPPDFGASHKVSFEDTPLHYFVDSVF